MIFSVTNPKVRKYLEKTLNEEQLDDILEIETGCRFGNKGFCTPENHPDCNHSKQ